VLMPTLPRARQISAQMGSRVAYGIGISGVGWTAAVLSCGRSGANTFGLSAGSGQTAPFRMGSGRYENSHFDPKYGEGELRSLLSGTVGSRVVALPYLEIKTPYSRARMPYPGSIYWTWNEGQN
jgi:hypothetical protein